MTAANTVTPAVTTRRGLAAEVWRPVLARTDEADLVRLLAADRVAIAIPHPDDETLALGGLLQRLSAARVAVRFVVATDGDAAYLPMGAAQRRQLATLRRIELVCALRHLGFAHPDVVFLGLPDSELRSREPELRRGLATAAADVDAWLAPWILDPHPDHQAVGEAAAAVSGATPLWGYPVWMRHGVHPQDESSPAGRLTVVKLTDREQRVKDGALREFDSQLVSPLADRGPVLPDHVMELFEDGLEPLLAPASMTTDVAGGRPGDFGGREDADRFESAYASSGDPWQVRTSWYEQRKYAATMAALPQQRYDMVWEPGCGLGELTGLLADRAGTVHAAEPSPTARTRAAAALTGRPNVEVTAGVLPHDVPFEDGSVDLVVFSEVLYYLDDESREIALAQAFRVLRSGGDLVVVHWRPLPADAWASGDQVSESLRSDGRWEPLVHHRDSAFVLDVFRRP